MKKNEDTTDNHKPAGDENVQPVFKPEYFWAFAALMLYKLGDVEAITLEHLEKFDAERDCPDIIWNAEKKSFIMKNKTIDRPVIIKVPKKLMKKLPKFMRN